MLNAAASCDKLAAAQWLRSRGTAWPTTFTSEFDFNGVTIKQCWSVSAIQWAIASGSGWREWKCEDYAADKYCKIYYKRRARDLLQWAHANGCPCTCGQQQQQ
jgi:hypothetical protein